MLMQWELDIALIKVKSLVSLLVPAVSLFMWISCHDTACLGHANLSPHHVLLLQCEAMLRQKQLIWDFACKCSEWAVHCCAEGTIIYLPAPADNSPLTLADLSQKLALPSHPGPQQCPGFSVQAECRLLAVASAHQIQSQGVMRREAL